MKDIVSKTTDAEQERRPCIVVPGRAINSAALEAMERRGQAPTLDQLLPIPCRDGNEIEPLSTHDLQILAGLGVSAEEWAELTKRN